MAARYRLGQKLRFRDGAIERRGEIIAITSRCIRLAVEDPGDSRPVRIFTLTYGLEWGAQPGRGAYLLEGSSQERRSSAE